MSSPRIVFIVLSLVFSFGAQATPTIESVCDMASGANIIGLAIDRTNQMPLYCEYHFEEYQEDTLQGSVVKYIDTDNQQIAEKQLDYEFSPFAPNVTQKDNRQGELRHLQYSKDGNRFLLEYKKNQEAEKKSVFAEAQTGELPMVADAGFDQFVKGNWQQLIVGQAISFSFLSPIHTRTIDLTIKIADRKSCGGIALDTEQLACFTVKPKSSMLRLFAKPLYLVYNKSSQRIAVFSGVVNLVNAEGKPKVADIYYWYKS